MILKKLDNGFSEHVVNLELVITSLYFQLISSFLKLLIREDLNQN